jgi:hypothetical protein
MSTTPNSPGDYLKVPTNRRLAYLNPNRSTSFIEQSNQIDESDERTASNSILPSTGNSTPRLPIFTRQRQLTSSRINARYSPVTAEEEEDKIEFSCSSLIVPIIESPPLIENHQIENTQTNIHRFPKPTIRSRLRKLLNRRLWSNPFSKGRYEKKIY